MNIKKSKKSILCGIVCFAFAATFLTVNVVSASESLQAESVAVANSKKQAQNPGAQINTGQVSTGQNPGTDQTPSYTTNEVIKESPIVETWIPRTAAEKEYYSYVGKEKLAYTSTGGQSVKIANSVQGPDCHKAFMSVLGNSKMARTYNIFPGNSNLNRPVYELAEEISITLEIPKSLQKEGRTFQMICVTENGKTVVLKDMGTDANTITIQTKYFYAFALCYQDK